MNARKLPYKERIQARKYLRAENKQFSAIMAPISFEQKPRGPFAAWRSRDFLCSAYRDQGFVRLSINRTDIDLDTGNWIAGISWDELMAIKEQCGFGKFWAVEVFPPASEIVNVANMRHLWVFQDAEPPAFGWKKKVTAKSRQIEPEEGEGCRECGTGVMHYPPVEGCRCHLHPPCSACTSNQLECNKCGWSFEYPTDSES